MIDYLISWSGWPYEALLIFGLYLFLALKNGISDPTPKTADADKLLTIRLEPARITVAAASALLVAIGFVFTVINGNSKALELLSSTFVWLWLYAGITLFVTVYQAMTVYGALYNGNQQPAWLDSLINNAIYIGFISILLRGTLIFVAYAGLPPATTNISPGAGTCCDDLRPRVEMLEKRVAELEQQESTLPDILKKIIELNEKLSELVPLDTETLGGIRTDLQNINATLGDLKVGTPRGGGGETEPGDGSLNPDFEKLFADLLEQQRKLMEKLGSGEFGATAEDATFTLVLTEALRLSRSIAELLNTLAGTTGETKTEAQKLLSDLLRKLTEKVLELVSEYLKSKINAVTRTGASGAPPWAVVEGPISVTYFGKGQSHVPESQSDELARKGKILKKRLECLILAQGYSDPDGDEGVNLRISVDRTTAVLNRMGIDLSDRVILSPLGKTVFPADVWSKTDLQDEELKALHRRVEISLLCPTSTGTAAVHDRDAAIDTDVKKLKGAGSGAGQ